MADSFVIKPEIIRWAVKRSKLDADSLVEVFPKLHEWQTGERTPTIKQLEKLAKKTMTPLGYFFLDNPPEEKLPIPDFRTMGDTPIDSLSPNLIDTIHAMQRRQDWMREYVIEEGQEPLKFIRSSRISSNVVSLASRIRRTLGLDPDWAGAHGTREEAFGTLRRSSEQIGIVVATSGIVGLNTHRKLDPEEFRGFVLCDEYAPLIFVNGAEFTAPQIFTLAHELVHLWIGREGLFNLIKMMPHNDKVEQFCNQVAAELLVPADVFQLRWRDVKTSGQPFQDLARTFKVSAVVAARRALDLRLISKARFFEFYQEEREKWRFRKNKDRAEKRTGGDFYRTQVNRDGRLFGNAIVRAVREGRLLYRDAHELTGLKGETFRRYAEIVLERMKNELQ